VIVNVCPAAVTSASPDAVWKVIAAAERYGEWTDATVLGAEPPGEAQPGQLIRMGGRALGRNWSFTIDVRDIDPQHRWIDLVVHLPFGIENYEHITLTDVKEGGTLVRFN
jgi:polyketide cyclase/dehydrase/lipid transport protein